MFKRIQKYFTTFLCLIFVFSTLAACDITKKSINETDKSKDIKTTADKINKDLLIITSENNKYALWYPQKGTENSKMEFDINDNLKNVPIILGFETPNGTKATIVIDDTGYNLIRQSNRFLKSAFDDYEELKDGYYLQASIFDFDKDGANEVIISIGNKSTELGISIFKYRNNNFTQIGYIEGKSRAFINKNGIIEIFDNAGKLLSSYEWNGTEFKKL